MQFDNYYKIGLVDPLSVIFTRKQVAKRVLRNIVLDQRAQVNFSDPEVVLFLNNHLASNTVLKVILVRDWGKMAPAWLR